jgi:linearmycin/streptolysin S transport system permease protein
VRAVLAIAANDLRLVARRPGDVFFTFGWPLIVAIFFGMLFAGPSEGRSGIPIALVDEDASEGSRAFADRLTADPALNVVRVSREEAERLVRRGKRTAYVVLTSGFGAAASRPFFGSPPEAEVGADPIRKAEAGMLESVLARTAAQGLQRLFEDRAAMQKQIERACSGRRSATRKGSPPPTDSFPSSSNSW